MYVVLMSQTCRPCDGNTRSCFHNRQEDGDGGRVDVVSAVQCRDVYEERFILLSLCSRGIAS
jgi:hypothetical protein